MAFVMETKRTTKGHDTIMVSLQQYNFHMG